MPSYTTQWYEGRRKQVLEGGALVAHKVCRRCGVEKSAMEFYRNPVNADRLQAFCIPCHRAYSTERLQRAEAREKTRMAIRLNHQRRYAQGKCGSCGQQCLPGLSRCLTHWAIGLIKSAKLTSAPDRPAFAAMVLDLLEEQGYRCALTGVALAPGRNASLDHIVPLAKGGTHERSNLRWVTYQVNVAKSTLSDEEFIAMCRAVVEHADSAYRF